MGAAVGVAPGPKLVREEAEPHVTNTSRAQINTHLHSPNWTELAG